MRFHSIIWPLMLTCGLLSGCSLMHDDLDECPSGVDLSFVYDYNIQRADMFPDHVGGLTVYVFDENGNYLTRQEEHNTSSASPLADHGYSMHLDLTPGKYQFVAVAHQKALEECLNTPGAKFRHSELTSGLHTLSDLNIILDREEAGVVNHQGLALDTLWLGKSKSLIEVKDMQEAHQTISLIRDTKNLTVSLHQLDSPADISGDDFEITIMSDNGKVAHDNTLLPDEMLIYTPYATWSTEFTTAGSRAGDDNTSDSDDVTVLERTAHAALSFNRLVHYSSTADNARNATLVVYNKRSQKTVARINLPDCLAQGRGAFEYYNYSPQEFLDREHDYKLDFFLKGDTWQYIDLSISIAAWSKRIQRVDL